MIHLSLKNNIHDNISVMGVRFTHRPYFWGTTDSTDSLAIKMKNQNCLKCIIQAFSTLKAIDHKD